MHTQPLLTWLHTCLLQEPCWSSGNLTLPLGTSTCSYSCYSKGLGIKTQNPNNKPHSIINLFFCNAKFRPGLRFLGMKNLPSLFSCLKKCKPKPISHELGRQSAEGALMLTHVELPYEAGDIVVFEVLGEQLLGKPLLIQNAEILAILGNKQK